MLRYTRLTDAQVLDRLLTVCEAEHVNYDDPGLEAVIFTAEGDMRQVRVGHRDLPQPKPSKCHTMSRPWKLQMLPLKMCVTKGFVIGWLTSCVSGANVLRLLIFSQHAAIILWHIQYVIITSQMCKKITSQ